MNRIILFVILLVLAAGKITHAEGKVIVVSMGRVQLEQLAADPHMSMWLSRGSIGLLNTGTAGGPLGRHIYVTLGAGSRALGTDSSRLAFMREEEDNGGLARDFYRRNLGKEPAGSVVQVGIADILRVNRSLQHPVQPGLLGDMLHAAGKKTALIGNADGSQYNREAAMIVADSQGIIDFGDVDDKTILTHDPALPYARRMHKERAWQKFLEFYQQAQLLVIDWGDTQRLDEYRAMMTQQVARQTQAVIFADLSWILTKIAANLHDSDLLILMGGVPGSGTSGAETLGFMVVLGAEYPPGMLLTSATTRRAGLAAITDFAPLVLDHLGIAIPSAMIGRSVRAEGRGEAEDLFVMRDQIDRTFRMRPPLLKTYVVFQIIFVLGALLNLFVRILHVRRFEGPLVSLLTVPVLLLYLPLHGMSVAAGITLTVVSVLAVTIVLLQIKDPVVRFTVIAAVTSLSLFIDIMRGAVLMKVSILGYDPVSGARYYGLGNEYMGVLVGSTVLAAAAAITAWPYRRRVLLAAAGILFIIIIIVMVFPNGGANFGGTLTSLIAFSVTMAVLLQIRPGWRSGAASLVVLLSLIFAAYLINWFVPGDRQSHLGRTLVLIQAEGLSALREIIIRKGAMNLKLFRYSQWSRVFLVFLGGLAVLFYRPLGVLRDLHKKYPALSAGFFGIIAGSITAFLVNDSGVVAAATTLLYAGVPIIILAARMVEKNDLTAAMHK